MLLFAFGNALGAKGRYQRAADLAAIRAAQVMRDMYPRLFEPPFIEPDVPNPRHLEEAEYRELAVAAAIRGGGRNGVRVRPADVSFGGTGFAATRVTVRVRGVAHVHIEDDHPTEVPVRASATAELSPDAGSGMPGTASGGGYDGPLWYRQGKPMRPDVALAFDRLAAVAREEAGLFISISSGFRSDAEQARLFAAQPNPQLFWAVESALRGPAARCSRAEEHLVRARRGTVIEWLLRRLAEAGSASADTTAARPELAPRRPR